MDQLHSDFKTCPECSVATSIPRPPISHLSFPRTQVLLFSNHQPLDEEIPTLQADLITLNRDVAAVDAQIAHLQTHIAELRAYRNAKQRAARTTESALSVYRRLSEDIWRAIFIEAVDPGRMERFERYGTRATPPPPNPWGIVRKKMKREKPKHLDQTALWVIPSVCVLWRGIAVNHSKLWSTVIANFEHPEMLSQSHSLQLQLERARSQDLTVHITGRSHHLRDESGHPHLIDILRPSSPQWTTLFLFAHNGRNSNVDIPPTSVLPRLRTVGFDGVFVEGKNLDAFLFLKNAPNLTEFIGPGLNQDLFGDTLRTWRQSAHITSLHSRNDIGLTLRRFPSLTTCEIITSQAWNSRIGVIFSPLRHQALASLTMVACTQQCEAVMDKIFDGLVLPSLESLHVSAPAKSLSKASTFLQLCGRRLKTLVLNIEGSPMSNADAVLPALFEDILHNTPRLKVLSVHGKVRDSHGDDSVLQVLLRSHDTGVPELVPMLETLWMEDREAELILDSQSFADRLRQLRPNIRIEVEADRLGLVKDINSRAVGQKARAIRQLSQLVSERS